MPRHKAPTLLPLLAVATLLPGIVGNPDAKRLYDDLLSNYNKLVRPVLNVSDALAVRIKLKLSQLIDVFLLPRLRNFIRLGDRFDDHINIRDLMRAGMRSSCESQESDHDDKPVGGTELVRLQTVLGATRVRRSGDAARTIRSHLAPRHRTLQQCGRQLRGDASDKGDAQLHRARRVAPARHLQVFLRDRRRVLPLRPADLRHEVRLLDIRRVPSRPAAHRRGARHQRRGDRRRPLRILQVRRVGHLGRARHQERKVLHLLRGAVPGHHVQPDDAPQDALLHRQLNHPVHGHIVPDSARILPALGQWREGLALHLHPALANRLLPATRRDHPPHLARRAAARQVRALYNDPRYLQHLRDCGGAERALPVAADAHDGAVGAPRLHSRAATPVGDAPAALPARPSPQPLRGAYGVRGGSVGPKRVCGRAARMLPARGRRTRAVRRAAPLAPLPRAAQGHRRHQLHRRADAQGGGIYQGKRGLEVRGDGAGPAIPVDFHVGSGGGLGRHNPAGADSLRRACAYRRTTLRDRVRRRQTAAALTDHADALRRGCAHRRSLADDDQLTTIIIPLYFY